tara:strand:+ start:2004 stop:2141 length:138 start_codon:yes stop_codon:yes gene_type:complete
VKYFLFKAAIPAFVVMAFLFALVIASIVIWFIPFFNALQNKTETI